MNMLRQCAWCLRLINHVGERLSTQPLPKLYEATHGMCSVCGALWMEQVFTQASSLYLEESEQRTESEPQYAVDFAVRDSSAMPVVCESSNEYSSRVMYPFSEEAASIETDDILDPGLTRISQQKLP
jgi:hypothetical protein